MSKTYWVVEDRDTAACKNAVTKETIALLKQKRVQYGKRVETVEELIEKYLGTVEIEQSKMFKDKGLQLFITYKDEGYYMSQSPVTDIIQNADGAIGRLTHSRWNN